jgi:hypothetical protein
MASPLTNEDPDASGSGGERIVDSNKVSRLLIDTIDSLDKVSGLLIDTIDSLDKVSGLQA